MFEQFFGLNIADRSKYILLFGAIAVIYTCSMFNHHLVPSMEPRFAEVVKEMIATDQYLVPKKNALPYVEYPPLYYWLSLAGKSIGLSTEAAIRLPAAIALLMWLLWLCRLQRLLEETKSGYAYALLGAAFPGILYQFFTAQSDSVLVLGVLIAFTGFVKHRIADKRSTFPWELWLGISLATAAKGPVGIACTLPVMVLEPLLAVYQQHKATVSRPNTILKSMFVTQLQLCWFRGLALLFITNLPWYLITSQVYGWDFVRAVVIYQNFDRYLSGFSHNHPWWYYLVTLSYDAFPASILLPFGIYFSWQKLNIFKYRLALLWFCYTLLFFSISASKQGKYMLPAAPAMVMLAFVVLENLHGKLSAQRLWKYLRIWSVGIISLWAVVVIFVLPFYSPKIGSFAAHQKILTAISKAPGEITHFQWPRSESLYYLGAPMAFVRSSRELYQRIHDGRIAAGDYVLVYKNHLAQGPTDSDPSHLIPTPAAPYMEPVLAIKSSHQMLYRVLAGASQQPIPATPEPAKVFWRNQLFDTD